MGQGNSGNVAVVDAGFGGGASCASARESQRHQASGGFAGMYSRWIEEDVVRCPGEFKRKDIIKRLSGGRRCSRVRRRLFRILSMGSMVYLMKEVKDIYMTIIVAHVL